MFFRRKHAPSGDCLQLLEAFRNAQGQPRHRVVVSLGNATIPEADQASIAQAVANRLYGQTELLPAPYSATSRYWIDQIIKRVDREGRWRSASKAPAGSPAPSGGEVIDGVLADHVSHTHTTPLGPSWVGWQAWQQLGLSECLQRLGWNQAQVDAAAITVLHRLVAPGSERALREWLPDSSLSELWGRNFSQVGKDRFYRISDRLLDHQAEIEAHLRDKTQSLFNLKRTILLYDLTNSYFEGEALGNSKAQRGCSKEKRNDCPQIVLGMVFDQEGFELAHQVFEGKQSDSKSLGEMVEALQGLLPASGGSPLVIVDGGVATRKNLQLLREKGFGYLVNESRRSRGRYQPFFQEDSQFKEIAGRAGKPPVRVRLLADPFAVQEPATEGKDPPLPDQLVLCKSQGRQEKEKAICSQAEVKYVAALQRLSKRVAKGQLKIPEKIHPALGRLQGKHPRVQRLYEVNLREAKASGSIPAPALTLEWHRKEADYQVREELFGCYVLRTERQHLQAEEIWELYMTLSQAEDGFKALKGDLGLRPNYHQLEERVDGHVFISVLAYQLLRYVLRCLEEQHDHRSWTTIKCILSTHCYTTMLLPTKSGTLYRIRKAGEPEEEQKEIYGKLKLKWKHLPSTKTIVTSNGATTL
ncbi:MAG: IS1634 family transposase [Acidobacteria bacterium]|nr:MAG: IS1634 family transposase [Acidobacteriota bacterium]